MNNTASIQFYSLKEAEIRLKIEELTLLDDEYILRNDFDGDGVVSFIDLRILIDAVTNRNHSPLYDKNNKTYNGKSLDIDGDGEFDIADGVKFVNDTLNWLKVHLPIEFDAKVFDYTKSGFNGLDWIDSYKESHDGNYPTLDELKTAYNQA